MDDICYNFSFESFTILKREQHLINGMALHIVTEDLEIVIQASAILLVSATQDINCERRLLTLASLNKVSSRKSRFWDAAHWLIHFKAALRLGLCPELKVTKTKWSSRSRLSAMDSNNDVVVLLSGPVTINPVRSLRFDLKTCQLKNIKQNRRHQLCRICTFNECSYFFNSLNTGVIMDSLTSINVLSLLISLRTFMYLQESCLRAPSSLKYLRPNSHSFDFL